jgi:geranylgeranyl diphosphate synthase, type II
MVKQIKSEKLSAFRKQLRLERKKIDGALKRFLPRDSQLPKVLHEAMRYSVLNGGKRIRPLLTLFVTEMLGGDEAQALIPASAIEFIHCYSLIHDDLPCLDNDDVRRGKATCHRKYGEAIALLAGDGLLTLAFHVLGKLRNQNQANRIMSELSRAAGTHGMVGGQVLDMLSVGIELDLPALDNIHIRKTGQLIKVSCLAGAIVGRANRKEERHILRFGEYLGFAFQIVDDILDGDGYLKHMGQHEAREKAADLIFKAKRELSSFKRNSELMHLTDLILNRGNKT